MFDVEVNLYQVGQKPPGVELLSRLYHLTEFFHTYACGELLDADPRLTSGGAFVAEPAG